MSSKVTMILTFIVSVVCPFIQELVDFIEALKGRSTEVTKAIRQASSDFQTEIDGAIKPKLTITCDYTFFFKTNQRIITNHNDTA